MFPENLIFLNFEVKNAGFYALLLQKKLIMGRNWDWGWDA